MAYIGAMSKRRVAAPAEKHVEPEGEAPPQVDIDDPYDEWIPDGTPEGRMVWTVNQLVAYNLQRVRKSRGWPQEVVARQLEHYTGRRWTNASVSAAERSWSTGRSRRFDANELTALAVIFSVPIDYFFLPPDGEEISNLHLRTSVPGDSYPHDNSSHRPLFIEEILDLLDASSWPSEYLDRLERSIVKYVGTKRSEIYGPRQMSSASWRSLVLGALYESNEEGGEKPEQEEPLDEAGRAMEVSEGDVRKLMSKALESVFTEQIDDMVNIALQNLREKGITFSGEDKWVDDPEE